MVILLSCVMPAANCQRDFLLKAVTDFLTIGEFAGLRALVDDWLRQQTGCGSLGGKKAGGKESFEGKILEIEHSRN